MRAWLLQRLTAVYMAAFSAFLFLHFATDPPVSFESWRDWVMRPEVSIATFVFFTALLLHAWVGIRDVVLDYLHPMMVRVPVLATVGFGLVALEAWTARILLIS
ncbi:MAG TPA: succinate dehydrogenase, hydrophobic membrane anchor protein [Burkholderiales bacterium]|nr:succinate dehydrogenase, hydrophobic membrane anchor protein [Burkholderiales bacterium]